MGRRQGERGSSEYVGNFNAERGNQRTHWNWFPGRSGSGSHWAFAIVICDLEQFRSRQVISARCPVQPCDVLNFGKSR
jgi:hypothetical protein